MMYRDIFYYCIEKYKYYQLISMKSIFCYGTKKKEL